MATSTTNLGLIKPAASDKIRIAQLNQNSDTLDAVIGPVGATSLQTQMNNVQDALAIIANGDTHPAITAGQFVYVKNNTHSVAEGLHVATANISANGQITTSNVSADASGGLNALNSNISGVDTKRSLILNNTNVTSDTFILGLDNGAYQVASSTDITEYLPYNYGTLYVAKSSNNYGMYLFESTVGTYFIRHKANATGWSRGWQQLALKREIENKTVLYQYSKNTSASGDSLTFSTDEDRYTALVIIVDNAASSRSGIYSVIYKKNSVNDVSKISGNGSQVSCDMSAGTITVEVGAWSMVIVMTTCEMT